MYTQTNSEFRKALAPTPGTLSLLFVSLLSLGVPVSASHAQPPDPARGQMLYENHCRFCHTAKVHERPNKPPLTRPQLRSIVNDWQHQEGLSWSTHDTEDVVDYLVHTRYRMRIED